MSHSEVYDERRQEIGQDVEKAILVPSNLSLVREASLSSGLSDVKIPYTRVNFGIPLYRYQEVPTFLKSNPYIVCGYRAELPAGMCIKRWVDSLWFHCLSKAWPN